VSYLIIAVVVLMVLSPIFWIMPSPKQKRQMQLRQMAMSLGFIVKIADLPQQHRARVRREKVEQGVTYRLPWEVKRRHPESVDFLLLRDPGEHPPTLDNPALQTLMQHCLDQLPESVVALEYAKPGLALYWRERGDAEVVAGLYQRLVQLRTEVLALESPN